MLIYVNTAIIRLWDERSSRSSPGSVFFGSPRRQYLPRQHLNVESPSIGNMLKIATSSSFSLALLILSSPTVFVCRCSLLDSRSLNASVAIFSLKTFIQTNTRAFTDCGEVVRKCELAEIKLRAFLYGAVQRSWLELTCDYNWWRQDVKINLREQSRESVIIIFN